MNITADSSLPGLKEAFPPPFVLQQYTEVKELPYLLSNQDILLCRSTLKITEALLKNQRLKYIATASSGTDHIDPNLLAAYQIDLIDAKGCNAASVADYLLATIAWLQQQKILSTPKKLGIIGLGMVGTKVRECLKPLQATIVTYDPLKVQEGFISCPLEQLYECDVLSIHAELHTHAPYPSYHLINQDFINQLKPHCIIINAARGDLVDENALLTTNKPLTYCTDVYSHEPKINPLIIEKATLCTPHIAGHNLEAKYRAVALVSQKLHQIAGLPLPVYATPPPPLTAIGQRLQSWQEQVLSIYNPGLETEQLKQAKDKQAAFLRLRQAHQQRHDFSTYLFNN